jgi:hypothetical protein
MTNLQRPPGAESSSAILFETESPLNVGYILIENVRLDIIQEFGSTPCCR